MKKNERHNGIIHLLRTRKRMSASDLAAYFEVSERTIYRDIDALSQLKVPIIAYEGMGGGYEIDSAYFMPSIKLSSDEILLMQMVLKAGEQLKIPNMTNAYKILSGKVENALEGEDRSKAIDVISHISFDFSRIMPKSYHESVLTLIFEAFWNKNNLDIVYFHPEKNEESQRRFSPTALFFEDGAWYLTGLCHLRGESRTLRLDRIRSLFILKEKNSIMSAEIPKAINDKFSIHAYELLIDPALYRIIKDDIYLSESEIIESSDFVHLKVTTPYKSELLNLVMTHPVQVKAISPSWFLDEITQMCKNLFKNYFNPDI